MNITLVVCSAISNRLPVTVFHEIKCDILSVCSALSNRLLVTVLQCNARFRRFKNFSHGLFWIISLHTILEPLLFSSLYALQQMTLPLYLSGMASSQKTPSSREELAGTCLTIWKNVEGLAKKRTLTPGIQNQLAQSFSTLIIDGFFYDTHAALAFLLAHPSCPDSVKLALLPSITELAPFSEEVLYLDCGEVSIPTLMTGGKKLLYFANDCSVQASSPLDRKLVLVEFWGGEDHHTDNMDIVQEAAETSGYKPVSRAHLQVAKQHMLNNLRKFSAVEPCDYDELKFFSSLSNSTAFFKDLAEVLERLVSTSVRSFVDSFIGTLRLATLAVKSPVIEPSNMCTILLVTQFMASDTARVVKKAPKDLESGIVVQLMAKLREQLGRVLRHHIHLQPSWLPALTPHDPGSMTPNVSLIPPLPSKSLD